MLQVRDILRENLVETYWLTNESSAVAEETSEMSLASQWYELNINTLSKREWPRGVEKQQFVWRSSENSANSGT